MNTISVELSFNCSYTSFYTFITLTNNGSVVTKFGDYDSAGNETHGNGYFYISYDLISAYSPIFNVYVCGVFDSWK